MTSVTTFPRLFAACLFSALLSITALAQDAGRLRQVGGQTQATTVTPAGDGRVRLENDLLLSTPSFEQEDSIDEEKALRARASDLGDVERLMLEAIEERLGAPYRLGSEGPYRFDCSGFVWSVFREAGFSFERVSARAFWSQFEPVDGDERYRFGTLVFFNNLNHVGIVADQRGFYHASTSRGVVYSTFSEYWARRISGFRRVPSAPGFVTVARR